MRSLAKVSIVTDTITLFRYPKLQLTVINNWKVLTNKNQYKIGDKVIYISIDSVLPLKPIYSSLKRFYTLLPDNTYGYHIKRIELAGVLTEGLILPIGIYSNLVLNTDLTKVLNIKHFNYFNSNYNYLLTNTNYIQDCDYDKLFNNKYCITIIPKGVVICLTKNNVNTFPSYIQKIIKKNYLINESYTLNSDIRFELVIVNNELICESIYNITNSYYYPPLTAKKISNKYGIEFVKIDCENCIIDITENRLISSLNNYANVYNEKGLLFRNLINNNNFMVLSKPPEELAEHEEVGTETPALDYEESVDPDVVENPDVEATASNVDTN